MNLRDFKYVIAVAETHHFGRAAERCYVSQPTLSGQIKKLEEELGIVIFERTKRSVEITPIGEEIVALARQLMEQADAIEQILAVPINKLVRAEFGWGDSLWLLLGAIIAFLLGKGFSLRRGKASQ